jgi:hypothetical protein
MQDCRCRLILKITPSFGLQQRNYLGLRLDYMAKNTAKEQLSFGGTIVRLGERPFFHKSELQ